ncbi:MAG: class II aldolase/adducin family protein [Bacillota bacterium]|nr:class II aldolase/adducin family protein [Bacillota bacterium]
MRKNIELVNKLVQSCHILSMEGHNDIILGHVSARIPESESALIKSSGKALWEVTPDDVIAIDFEGTIIDGNKKCHKEYPIHTEVYRLRDEINCVIHTHPFYSTIISAAGISIKPVSNEGTIFLDTPIFTDTTELIQTSEQGVAVAKKMGNNYALLLQNHGIVVAGRTIEEATIFAVRLEKAARAQYFIEALGSYNYTNEDECKRKIEQTYDHKQIQNFWDYYLRKLNTGRFT